MRTGATGPTRLILQPLGEIDPRTTLDDTALVLASRNAFPIVAKRQARKDTGGLILGGGIALLLGGVTFWSMSGHRAPPTAPPPLNALTAPASRVFTSPSLPAPVLPPQGSLMMPSVPSVTPPPAVDHGPAPVVVFDSGAAPVVTSASGETAVTSAKSPVTTGGNENDQFALRVGGAGDVATAQQLTNPATTVTQGTLIPAVLETAIDTDLPGFVRAVVSRDVRAFDGKQVLIPRSSRLIGQYKSGLSAGQTRAYVIWSRLIRPDGASVALGSPAVDFTGTSGLAGKVDGHFMQRFGSAVLLSVVGGLGALGSSGTSVILQGGGQSAAGVAAQRDTAIPPTVRIAQGQPIRVFTARDLDFSTVAAVGSQP